MRGKTGMTLGLATLATLVAVPLVFAVPVWAATRTASTAVGRAPAKGAQVAEAGSSPTAASFGDGTIDLAQGWGSAQACAAFASGATECFATEAEMNSAIAPSASTSANEVSQLKSALRDKA